MKGQLSRLLASTIYRLSIEKKNEERSLRLSKLLNEYEYYREAIFDDQIKEQKRNEKEIERMQITL